MASSIASIVSTDLKPGNVDSSAVISAIGTSAFADELLLAAHNVCGAEHCAILQFNDTHLYGMAGASLDHSQLSNEQLRLYVQGDFWRRDPGMIESQRQISNNTSSMVRVDIAGIDDALLRTTIWSSHDIAHRMLLWTGTPQRAFGISLCRSRRAGDFSTSELADLERMALPFLSMLRKHAAISWSTPRFPDALTSLDKISDCVRSSVTPLPRREFEVCTRLIYGMTTTGIALELGIGEGSVVTYRKRIYERLNMGSQRELLVWYVQVWDQMFNKELKAA